MLPRTFESTKKNWLQNEREILDGRIFPLCAAFVLGAHTCVIFLHKDSAEPTSSIKTAQSWFEFVQVMFW